MKGKITYREIVIILVALIFVYLWFTTLSNSTYNEKDNSYNRGLDSVNVLLRAKSDSLLTYRSQRDSLDSLVKVYQNNQIAYENYRKHLDETKDGTFVHLDTAGRVERYSILSRLIGQSKL